MIDLEDYLLKRNRKWRAWRDSDSHYRFRKPIPYPVRKQARKNVPRETRTLNLQFRKLLRYPVAP